MINITLLQQQSCCLLPDDMKYTLLFLVHHVVPLNSVLLGNQSGLPINMSHFWGEKVGLTTNVFMMWFALLKGQMMVQWKM
jgi:hypothetical protein